MSVYYEEMNGLRACACTHLSQHLFFRGAEGLAEKSRFPLLLAVIGFRTMFNLMAVNFLLPLNRGAALDEAFLK